MEERGDIMKRRYFCRKVRDDSLVVRNSENGEPYIFRVESNGSTTGSVDAYLNSAQVCDLVDLLQTWVKDEVPVALWEDIK